MSSKFSVSDCDYFIFPGKCDASFPQGELYAKVYDFWKAFWIREMTLAGGDLKYVQSDDFLRQDAISVLYHPEGGVAAMALNTVYRIDQAANRDSKFFSIFPPAAFEQLEKKQARSVSTIEFLAVNPEWREAKGGASLGPVMIKLSLLRAQAAGVDVSLGVARTDNHVSRVAGQFGGEALGIVSKVNIECEIRAMYSDRISPYPRPEVDEVALSFWPRRHDFTATGANAPASPRHLKVA